MTPTPTEGAYDPAARFAGDAWIPGLEAYGLARVPGHDDANPGWRAEWFDWRDRVVTLRDRVQALCEKNASARADELAVCAEDPAYWLCMYGWIEEPRGIEDEDPIKNFVPFAFQVDLLQWFVRHASAPGKFDGYVSKCRGLGASWIFCAGALWGFLFREWRGILVSYKEDLVYAPKSMKALFTKIVFMMEWLPRWMLPQGFSFENNVNKNVISHPNPKKKHVTIEGEATTSKTARGGRATYVLYDEGAFIENFKDVWNTGFGTTDHRFAVSTESYEEGRDWENAWQAMRRANPEAVKELGWWQNAYQDEAWYAAERQRALDNNDLEGFEREVERNPRAGFGAWVYPMAADLPVDPLLAYDPSKILCVGIDPGHADDTAVVLAQVRWVDGQRGLAFLDSYERNLMPVQFYAHLLTGIAPEPGDEVWGYEFTPRERALMAFFAALPWGGDRVRFMMDPAGAARHNGLSFKDLFALKTLALRRREQERDPVPGRVARAIPVYAEVLRGHNAHNERRHATRALLTHSCYAATEGALRVRECLANRKFQKMTEKTTSEPKPLHDDFSHVATAVEYVCTFAHYGLGEPKRSIAPGERRRAALARRRAA